MGNIDWLPISELPEAFKDGRYSLFWGAWAMPIAAAWDDVDRAWWPFLPSELPIENPTHFAEINPPGEGDPGIPMYQMRKD